MKDRKDFALYAVNIGEVDGVVKKRMAEAGWTFPALLDTKSAVSAKYGITGHPETFFIDKKGKIAAIAIGGRNWDNEDAKTLTSQLFTE